MSEPQTVSVLISIGAALIILFLLSLRYLKNEEGKLWNRGRCLMCRSPWIKFLHSNEDGRGYYCENCGKHIWIFFSGIEDQKRK